MNSLRNLTIVSAIVLSILAFVPGAGAVLLVNETLGVDVSGHSQATITGGSTGGYLHVSGNSQVTITGGSIEEYLHASGNSQVTITGGSIGEYLHASGNSQVTITGGSIGEYLHASGNGQVTIEGFGFNYPYGMIADSTGILTGTLGNGDPIDNRFYVHGSASIVLTPEPTTLLLLGLGALALRRRRP